MTFYWESGLFNLVQARLGHDRARDVLSLLNITPSLFEPVGDRVPRAVVAMALNVLLFDRFLQRAPAAASYVSNRRMVDAKVQIDHAAVCALHFRRGSSSRGAAGDDILARILPPLGYDLAGVHARESLMLADRVYTHVDHQDTLPQMLISEVQVDGFSPAFQAAAARVSDQACDPLSGASNVLLAQLRAEGWAGQILAEAGIAGLAAAFERLCPIPVLEDYEALLAESVEAAWVATEGWSVRHMAARVESVEAAVEAQRGLEPAGEAVVAFSAAGRVRHIDFPAIPVENLFHEGERVIRRSTPGAVWRLVSRGRAPDGRLELSLDGGGTVWEPFPVSVLFAACR